MKIVKFNLPKWFLEKNNLLSKCSCDRRNGYGYVSSDFFSADKETLNAYYIAIIGWVPKSIVCNLQVKDYDLDMLLKQKQDLEEKKQVAHRNYKLTHSDEDFEIEDKIVDEIRIIEQKINEVKRYHLG